MNAAIGAGAANTGSASNLLIGDGQSTGFPAGTPADDFGMRINGNFTLNDGDAVLGELITLTFLMRSDDGSQLRIFGQDFAGTGGDARTTLIDEGGDLSLTADFFTGDTNAFGSISLIEGTFDFEALMYEGGGGANFRLFYALGDKTATGDDGSFVALRMTGLLPTCHGSVETLP